MARITTGSTHIETDSYVIGTETRYDISSRWDLGAHYHLLDTPDYNLSQDSYGISSGFDLVKNLWFSVGYNWQGYHDDDFSSNGYTAQGPYVKLRFKFDQNTFDLKGADNN